MSKLYIVPTPIGNLEDMTFRAIRVLKEVDFIMAEDTRTSKFLMNHYEIKTPLYSHHKFNEHKSVDGVIKRIENGESVALISDAGTPSISDPGYLLVKGCIDNEIEVETLPGATAFVPALVNSGFPTDSFIFEGFLPHKKGKQTKLKQLALEQRTIILYESPYRVVKTLEQMKEFFGEERRVSLSRELSKKFEETVRGTIAELIIHFTEKPPKGEFVMIVDGNKE